ncbi:MAG: hypothetical protein LH471_06050 [Salinibacterium sp.]|nr:hypothetical protein [Salinibacterium sp.]
MGRSTDRAINPAEVSEVKHPGILERYGARWLAFNPTIADVVENFWAVHQDLSDEINRQSIIAQRAVTVSLGRGGPRRARHDGHPYDARMGRDSRPR